MSLLRYEAYKSSGVSWLKEIPAHWEFKSAKSLFKIIDERSQSGREELLTVSSAYGVVPRSGQNVTMFMAKSYVGHKLCWPNDLVINSLWAWARGLGFSQHHGIISTAYSVYRLKMPSYSVRFLDYLLRSDVYHWEFLTRSKGIWISRLQLSDWSFMDMPILLPLPSEQEAIVRYLDHATRKIDRAVRTKKKLIAALNEQKQAIIAHAVTRGLDPNVPMKKSGVTWLGEIPAHWEMKKLRSLLSPVSLRDRSDLPLLSVVREKGIILRDTENKEENHNFIPEDLSNYKVVQQGQFVMNKMKAWQGSYGVSGYEGIVSPAYYVFDLNSVLPEFFHKALRSKAYIPFFTQASDGVRIGQWDLSQTRMKEIPFWIPPENEQKEISKYIDVQISSIESAIKLSENEIELLEEYKTRLIADAVTGAVDVQELVNDLPEIIDETDDENILDKIDDEAVEEMEE